MELLGFMIGLNIWYYLALKNMMPISSCDSYDSLPSEKTSTLHNAIIIIKSCHVTYAFQSESTPHSCLNVKDSLLKTGTKSEVYVTATGLEPTTT